MRIDGACHCGNIRFALHWPDGSDEIPVRECSCTFCRKHGGSWTSHPESEVIVEVDDASLVSKYNFGTRTADFHVCSACGVVPVVISRIRERLYAVVNVNAFDDREALTLSSSTTNFDGEGTGDRLDRRQRNWIPTVRLKGT